MIYRHGSVTTSSLRARTSTLQIAGPCDPKAARTSAPRARAIIDKHWS
jgi:hypothetical protein